MKKLLLAATRLSLLVILASAPLAKNVQAQCAPSLPVVPSPIPPGYDYGPAAAEWCSDLAACGYVSTSCEADFVAVANAPIPPPTLPPADSSTRSTPGVSETLQRLPTVTYPSFAGTWAGQSFWNTSDSMLAGFDRFDVGVDSLGEVNGGSYFENFSVGTPVPVDDGQFRLDGHGDTWGYLVAGGFRFPIGDFRANDMRNFMSGAFVDELGFTGISLSMRKAASYFDSDRSGTWEAFSFVQQGTGGALSAFGPLLVDEAGVLLSGSIQTFSDGSCIDYGPSPTPPGSCVNTASTFSIDQSSGALTWQPGELPLQMSGTKNVAVGATETAAGDLRLTVLVRNEASDFSTPYLEGNWEVFAVRGGELPASEFKSTKSELTLAQDGTVLSAKRFDAGTLVDTALGGSLSMNSSGFVSGVIDWSLVSERISGFKMDDGKEVIFGTTVCDDALASGDCSNPSALLDPSLSVWIRVPEPQLTVGLAGGILLLTALIAKPGALRS